MIVTAILIISLAVSIGTLYWFEVRERRGGV